MNESHLRWVLGEYLDYYNVSRPYQGLEQQSPIPGSDPLAIGIVNWRKMLGGIVKDYLRIPGEGVVSLS
jgi:hypothetical protein